MISPEIIRRYPFFAGPPPRGCPSEREWTLLAKPSKSIHAKYIQFGYTAVS